MFFLSLAACGLVATEPEPKPPEPEPKPAVVLPPPELPLPAGAAVVRECFAVPTKRPAATSGGASPRDATVGSNRHQQGVGAPRPGAAPPRAAAPALDAPAPAPEASATAAPAGNAEGSADPSPVAGKTVAAEPVAALEDQSAAAPTAAAPMPTPSPRPAKDHGTLGKRGNKGEEAADLVEAAPKAPVLGWGATTWLSNDDSMSLASAQRLLWAVQNKGPVQTSEIRPHELLNYFSFDTTPVAPGDTFSVAASAESVGDGTFGLALAVRGVTPPRRPLDLTLVLDRSGSMWAEGRMEYLKRGLTTMNGRLLRGDRVDVVLFDDDVCTPLEDYVVGRDDPSLFSGLLARLEPRGATDLNAGLQEGYRITSARTDTAGRNRRMLLISDALLNEGEIDPDVVSEVGKGFNEGGVRLSAIGVGRTFNDKVLDLLSEKGQGAYVYLGSEAVVDRIFGPGFDALTETVANDVRFALDLPDSLAMAKFYGEESSSVKADIQPIDYYAGTTQLFLQDLTMRPGPPVSTDRIVLTVEWTDPRSGERRTRPHSWTIGELLASDPHNLRKGRALMAWTDLIFARSLGNDPCAQPYAVWSDRVGGLSADAEIAWLDSVTAPLCGRAPHAAADRGVAYKVKLDADQLIAEATLRCSGRADKATISGNVATFRVEPGTCEIEFPGVVPLVAAVNVPKTGGEVRCVLRGGKLSCG